MTRDELELMWEIKQVCDDVPSFVLAFTSGELTSEEERAFGQRWAAIADRIVRYAADRERVVIDGDVEHGAVELEP